MKCVSSVCWSDLSGNELQTSRATVLNRIAGGAFDEQFLDVSGLDGPARCRVAYDLLKLGQSQNDVHIAEAFGQTKTVATPTRMGLTP